MQNNNSMYADDRSCDCHFPKNKPYLVRKSPSGEVAERSKAAGC